MGASATIAGQNLGAGNPDRAVAGVRVASRMGLAVAGVFGMTDPTVLALGRQLLLYLSVSGFFITVALSYTGGLQGTGDTKSPLYISLVSQVIIPIGLCTFLQGLRGLEAGDIWLAIVIGHFTRAVLSFWRFRQQKWRRISVDIEPAPG